MTSQSGAATLEQMDSMDAQSGAIEARVSLNQHRMSTLKAQSLDLKDHKDCLTRGIKKGGFKCVNCNQLIAYSTKVVKCTKCKANFWLYFEEQETTLRKQIDALEDELSTIQDK